MTPPERPEVAHSKHWSEVRRPKEAAEPLTLAEEASLRANLKPGERRNLARVLATLDAERQQRRATAAEPLRGALDPKRLVWLLEQGAYSALGDELRAALEATAPSTPEPALDMGRLTRAIEAAGVDGPFIAGSAPKLAEAIVKADQLLRVALTSESRAAAPQEGTDG